MRKPPEVYWGGKGYADYDGLLLASPANVLVQPPPALLFQTFGPANFLNTLVQLQKPACVIGMAQADPAVTQVLLSFQQLGAALGGNNGQFPALSLIGAAAARQFLKFVQPIQQFYVSAQTGGTGFFTLFYGGVDEMNITV